MKHLLCLALLLVLMPSVRIAHAGPPETRACEFKAKAGCVSGDVSVTLADGAVAAVEITVHWCGLRGRPGYTCMINASRNEQDYTWSDEGGATLIANASPFNPDEPDRMKVTVGRHVSIDLEQAQSAGTCGAGAQLPRAIVIPAQRRTCRVWLGAE
jgi:hypothetical protein